MQRRPFPACLVTGHLDLRLRWRSGPFRSQWRYGHHPFTLLRHFLSPKLEGWHVRTWAGWLLCFTKLPLTGPPTAIKSALMTAAYIWTVLGAKLPILPLTINQQCWLKSSLTTYSIPRFHVAFLVFFLFDFWKWFLKSPFVNIFLKFWFSNNPNFPIFHA